MLTFEVHGKMPDKVQYEGEQNLIIRNIQPEDHGCYECVVQNTIATLTKQSCLFVDSKKQ